MLAVLTDDEPRMRRVHDLFLELNRAEGPAWEALLDQYEAALAEWISHQATLEQPAA